MAAPMFPVNTHRHDPYRTFKFQSWSMADRSPASRR